MDLSSIGIRYISILTFIYIFCHVIEFHREDSDLVERFIDVAMPQGPFEALQLVDDGVPQCERLLLVLDRVRQPFRRLLHDGQAHRVE